MAAALAASGLDLEKGASQVLCLAETLTQTQTLTLTQTQTQTLTLTLTLQVLCLAETISFTRDAEGAVGRGGKQVARVRPWWLGSGPGAAG